MCEYGLLFIFILVLTFYGIFLKSEFKFASQKREQEFCFVLLHAQYYAAINLKGSTTVVIKCL